jgi:DNA repair photolyase
MSDQIREIGIEPVSNVIPFPFMPSLNVELPAKVTTPVIPTPRADEIIKEAQKLDALSKYPCTLDYGIYQNIERRYVDKPIRGGIAMKTAFRLVNSHNTCQQCLYAFEVDTYGRGCAHDCVYCYAKAELTVHGYWNQPIPVPIDFNEVRKAFYTTFETDKRNKWRELLLKKIPLRIGSMSDSFMWSDTKYKVTQELLRLLKFYNYPYVVFTRSDLVAHDDYLKLLDPKLAAIQFSMSSTNDDLIRKIEPGAPSAKRRLKALQKLAESGYWTTVRINPLFPIHPDGYFTNPNFKWDGPVPKFNYSSFEMVDELAAHKVPAVLAGFVRLSRISLNSLERATGENLRQFYDRTEVNKSWRDFHFSDKEIRYYYEQIKSKCKENGIQFTTCYIGNGEGHFWNDQDIWSNKKDCCNVKGRVESFKTDSREVPFATRLKFTNHKCSVPTSTRLHDELGHLKKVVATPAENPQEINP